MNFQVGDTVMHWSLGLGRITGKELRNITGKREFYYVVRIQDLDVWVPADHLLEGRLRLPTAAPAFEGLFEILSGPAQTLPSDRRERKAYLHTRMGDGNVESTCHVIRDLSTLEQTKALSLEDKQTLKRARERLLGEWEYALNTSRAQAEDHLHQLLKQPSL